MPRSSTSLIEMAASSGTRGDGRLDVAPTVPELVMQPHHFITHGQGADLKSKVFQNVGPRVDLVAVNIDLGDRASRPSSAMLMTIFLFLLAASRTTSTETWRRSMVGLRARWQRLDVDPNWPLVHRKTWPVSDLHVGSVSSTTVPGRPPDCTTGWPSLSVHDRAMASLGAGASRAGPPNRRADRFAALDADRAGQIMGPLRTSTVTRPVWESLRMVTHLSAKPARR